MSSVFKLSASLAKIAGVSNATRTDGLKRVWDYIRTNNLQNPTNKKEILPNSELRAVMNQDVVKFQEVLKFISPHFELDPNAPKVPRIPKEPKPKKERKPKEVKEPKEKKEKTTRKKKEEIA